MVKCPHNSCFCWFHGLAFFIRLLGSSPSSQSSGFTGKSFKFSFQPFFLPVQFLQTPPKLFYLSIFVMNLFLHIRGGSSSKGIRHCPCFFLNSRFFLC